MYVASASTCSGVRATHTPVLSNSTRRCNLRAASMSWPVRKCTTKQPAPRTVTRIGDTPHATRSIHSSSAGSASKRSWPKNSRCSVEIPELMNDGSVAGRAAKSQRPQSATWYTPRAGLMKLRCELPHAEAVSTAASTGNTTLGAANPKLPPQVLVLVLMLPSQMARGAGDGNASMELRRESAEKPPASLERLRPSGDESDGNDDADCCASAQCRNGDAGVPHSDARTDGCWDS